MYVFIYMLCFIANKCIFVHKKKKKKRLFFFTSIAGIRIFETFKVQANDFARGEELFFETIHFFI